MKKLLLILACVLVTSGLSAQFQIGLQGGAGYNMLNIETPEIPTEPSINQFNYFGGIFTRFDFATYYLELAPSYQASGSLTFKNASTEWSSEPLSRVMIPFRAGRHFISGLRIFLGPCISVPLLFQEEVGSDISGSLFNFLNTVYFDYRVNVILQAGIGFDISQLSLSLTYNLPFGDEFYMEETAYDLYIKGNIPSLNLALAYRL